MKQRVSIAACLGYLTLLTGCAAQRGSAASIGIIGGADGPTAIFVTTKFSMLPTLLLLAVAVVLILLFVRYRRRKK